MGEKITEAEVRHVAKLARLQLEEKQVKYFTAQLAGLLEYIGKLNELDVSGVQPMAHPSGMTGQMRADLPVPPLPLEAVLSNAPETDGPYFKVPKVLEEGPSA